MKRKLVQFLAFLICSTLILDLFPVYNVSATGSKIKRRIVLLLDNAADTVFNDEKGNELYRASTSIDDIKQAAKQFVEDVYDTDDDVMISVISYSDEAELECGFTNNERTISSTISGLTVGGAYRNMTAGLKKAGSQFTAITDKECRKTLVVISPGLITYGEYTSSGHWSKESTGAEWRNVSNSVCMYEYANSAYEEAQKIKDSGITIYTIGTFKNLENVPDAVDSAVTLFKNTMEDIATSKNHCRIMYDISSLRFAFEVIAFDPLKDNCGVFKYASGDDHDYMATYYYKDSYFRTSAEEYNASLATMSLCLALSAFGSNEKTSWDDQSKNVTRLLSDLGFDHVEVNDDFKKQPDVNTMGVAVGMKTIKVVGEDVTLIALATRGGNYFSEWGGNFLLGEKGNHEGFIKARDIAYNYLNTYINQYESEIKGRIKLWIAGYSRGGATANLLAGKLTDELRIAGHRLRSDDIYAYCFEPPMGANASVIDKETAQGYTNINNIVNPNDIVPLVAMDEWDFFRYGVDRKVIPNRNSNADYYEAANRMMQQYVKLNTECTEATTYTVEELNEELEYRNEWWHLFSKVSNDKTERFKSDVELGYAKTVAERFSAAGKDYDENYVSLVDLFQYHNCKYSLSELTSIGNLLSYQEVIDGSKTANMLNKSVVKRLVNNIGSRKDYSDYIQSGLTALMRIVKGENPSEFVLIAGLVDAIYSLRNKVRFSLLTGLIPGGSGITGIINTIKYDSKFDEIIDKVYDSVIDGYKSAGIDIYDYLEDDEVDDFEEGVKKLIIAIAAMTVTEEGWSDVVSLYKNTDVLGNAHYPELCLAWLQSNDKNYMEDAKKIMYVTKYRVLRINCPVDVTVYNSEGDIVAEIVDDEPQEGDGNRILFTCDAGEKILYMPLDGEYRVNIRATDNGVVNVSLNEYEENDTCTELINYYDLIVENGDEIDIVVPQEYSYDGEGNSVFSASELVMTSCDGVIAPSLVLQEDEIADEMVRIEVVNVNSKGGISLGGGEFLPGSFVSVKAAEYPDCVFNGWYSEGQLLSTEREYRFRAEESMTVSAVFEGETVYGQNGIFDVKLISSEGGSIEGITEFSVLDGYPALISARANEGYSFSHWEIDGNCMVEDANNDDTILILDDEDVVVEAIFVKSEESVSENDKKDENETEDDKTPDVESDDSQKNINPDEQDNIAVYIENCEIEYKVEDFWNDGYNAYITIKNIGSDDIMGWGLEFIMPEDTDIFSVWNGVLDYVNIDEKVKVHINNAEWNRIIHSGDSVIVGMTVCGNFSEQPEDFILYSGTMSSCSDQLGINYWTTSEWNGGFTGQIEITNLSGENIYDWSLELKTDACISSVWNAILDDEKRNICILTSTSYNSIIRPGEQIMIGFNAAGVCDISVEDINIYYK